ncbi:class I SAM-dependent methyltransferase [Candidatus Cetobacterium colombiensis]|uniref:Methyltransferase domain-containing protein n=1 Tax=Candidatus Cetobacterium colombiensis TaxID=3073100 RepID=A0ABU4W9H6_9FUSO|nr:methyltransferase domain-containing protein [Candidatus Cetobacterium colombiensis]MDX8336183.1 methyltransferase domain-containing protein [Candidatus Cetobacterium colombiensis]
MKIKKSSTYKKNTINFFNKMANKNHGDSFKHYDNVIKWIKNKNGTELLDIGTGKGDLLEKILLIYPNKNWNLVGIDISEKMIEKAVEKNISAKFKVGDSENLPFKNSSFDIITCINSFHHYENPEKAISEIKRVLRPGGIIILGEIWIPGFFRNIINFFLPFMKTGDYKIYSSDEIRYIFTQQNIIQIDKKNIFPSNCTYLLKKAETK